MMPSTPRTSGSGSVHLSRRDRNSNDDFAKNENTVSPPRPPVDVNVGQTSQQQQLHHQEMKIEHLPLTWNETRFRLIHTMEQWKSERKKQQQRQQQQCIDVANSTSRSQTTKRGWRSKLLLSVDDPDIVLLAIPLSLLFTILQFILPYYSETTTIPFTKMQRAAAVLFLISSLTSAWITRRRRRVSRYTDRSIERRRCVSAFLEGMKSSSGSPRQVIVGKSSCESQNKFGKSNSESQHHSRSRHSSQQQIRDDFAAFNNIDTVPRKNVEDVYSTYRLIDDDPQEGTAGDQRQGQWHRIPSLLLAKGDFVALKVGDTAPAKCTPVRVCNHGDANEGGAARNVIEAGERLAIDSLSPSARESLGLDKLPASLASFESTSTLPTSNTTKTLKSRRRGVLQPGRSTLTNHSEDMLLLANGVQVFALLETPLESFLRKEGLKRNHSTPQVLRQGEAVRAILLRFSIVVAFATVVILLIRPGGAQNFFQNPTWTLPLISALGVLPVSTPVFLFWVECCGVSRILASVHRFASNQKSQQKVQPRGVQNSVRSSRSSGDISSSEQQRGLHKPSPWLVCRYLMTTSTHRLFRKSLIKKLSSLIHLSEKQNSADTLLSIPPASLHLLEKLGVVTALTIVDDELACEPHSSPQQLLIPSGSGQGGFTLLDICPVCDITDDEESEERNANPTSRRQSSGSFDSEDSNDEVRFLHTFSAPRRTFRKFATSYRKRNYVDNRRRQNNAQQGTGHLSSVSTGACGEFEDRDDQFEFEDPDWWTYLPSLKAIGLACLMVEEGIQSRPRQILEARNEREQVNNQTIQKVSFSVGESSRPDGGQTSPLLTPVETSLIDHICCDERKRKQLRLLAQCIGFETSPNKNGPRGDLSSFHERRRLHILSANLLRQRMQLDSHALGLEESRNWSRLFTDADTIFVRDKRSGGDLVLTVGDARVVTQLCPNHWQGENSTIAPLTAEDRKIIHETQKNWMLSDLDVQAFSYAPLPFTADQKIEWGGAKGSHIYLLDNASSNASIPSQGFWSLVKNQIFLGLLGSSVRPRKEIEPLVDSCAEAGVRFVYFSPRNMRRTKELASQMGIDVAWNCAISLRPLKEGTDDSFRMTSNYADWDVNARLPHGVDDVRRHLKEVDNVPLLVSLYTDVTKRTAAEMVNVFQEYNDTVLSVGLSHLPGNQEIFSRADIAIGANVLAEDITFNDKDSGRWNALQEEEIAFVTRISAHSSVFNLLGSRATSHLVDIIRVGRTCLEAASSGVTFVLSGCLSFSIFIVLCPCTASTSVPTINALGSFLFTQVLLPLIGLSMVATDEAQDFMTRVPPKNDPSVKYALRADRRQYLSALLKAALPAILPQFLYLIALDNLMWDFDAPFLEEYCLNSSGAHGSILRCEALRDYSGPATQSAATITLAALALCSCVTSASYVFRTESIISEPPWRRNNLWFGTLILSIVLIAIYLKIVLESGSMAALSWYFYVLFLLSPFLCLGLCEIVKKKDQRLEKRAAMMRRLQFETRLGMWSPKESFHPGEP